MKHSTGKETAQHVCEVVRVLKQSISGTHDMSFPVYCWMPSYRYETTVTSIVKISTEAAECFAALCSHSVSLAFVLREHEILYIENKATGAGICF